MNDNVSERQYEEILVVDDTTENLSLLNKLLRSAGYQVRLADDGNLAVMAANARPPALILLDVRMPGMDGFEVCRRLKAEERTASIPVIFISVLENERDKLNGFLVGGVDYINKPFHAEEVLARVRTHLALRRALSDLEDSNRKLAAARDELELRVAERTEELAKTNACLLAEIAERNRTAEELRESEARYRCLFEDSPISLWEQDFSAVKLRMDDLRSQGVINFSAYFDAHPEIVSACVSLVRIVEMNTASLRLYGAATKSELGFNLDRFLPPETYSFFKDELVWIAEGRTNFIWEGINYGLSGSTLYVRLRLSAAPGYEKNFAKVLVSIEDITERKLNEEKITKALAEKGALLAELYHRTKNNMQVICSILALQSQFLQNDEVKSVLRDLENRINSMAIIQDKLFLSKNLLRINMKEYIHDLVYSLNASLCPPQGKVNIDLSEIDDVEIPIDYALPCGMALNELVTNSLKHAFPGDKKGSVKISLHYGPDGTVNAAVADNGIGVASDIDFQKEAKMGYLLIRSLVESQLQGRITIETDRGLSYHFEFRTDWPSRAIPT